MSASHPRLVKPVGQDKTTLRTSDSACKSSAMFDWLRNKFTNKSPLAQWSVSFEDGEIVTSDGLGGGRRMKLCDLTRVVVAIGDGNLGNAEVFFVLYSRDPTAACLFPMEAKGRDNFVAWMSTQPDYDDRELARAMGSTKAARFEILVVHKNGS